ncbi:facilitated trehalose transporter Tret1-like [Copidosoma floridanum]|uniref:facilitated trehalose transporter Tret1-like n=1 Tax=Copidosoma floridanum TaxID=29053 RepID=UPI0006C94223|nr:facilitated trehalose transporter Tret1-like [Copidosoma floridanum]
MPDDKVDSDFIDYVEPEESHSVSTLRKSISQYCAVLIASLLAITYGFSVGFTIIITHQLQNDTRITHVTDSQITWIGSMNYFSTPLGAMAGGALAQRLGRRNTLLLLTIPYFISWMLISYSSTVNEILIAFIVIGTAGGIVDPTLQVYATEISESRLRGEISCFITTTIMFGVFLQTIVGMFVDWRNLAMFCGLAPAFGLLLIGFVPESPYWLASKGRLGDARQALCRLRGWTTPQMVRHEYDQILQSTVDLNSSYKPPFFSKEHFKRMSRPAVRLPFILVSFAFFVSCFNGTTSILTYALDTFELLESPINIHTATIIFTGLQMLGSILLFFIVPKTGKRWPTFVSLIVAGSSFLIVSVYVFMRNQRFFKVSCNPWLKWIPLLALEISVFATTLGIETTPWILVGEVFPGDVRACATGLVTSIGFIFAAVASKIFHSMLSVLTVSGTFMFFATVNYVGLVVLYYFMPETEGRTLAEIEEHFAGKHKLDDPTTGPEGTELMPINSSHTNGTRKYADA